MGTNKRTVKQQMRYWLVGIGYNRIKIRARTARSAARIYMRGNLRHDILCRDRELDNPSNPRAQMPSDEMKNPNSRKWAKHDAAQYSVKDIHVEPFPAPIPKGAQ